MWIRVRNPQVEIRGRKPLETSDELEAIALKKVLCVLVVVAIAACLVVVGYGTLSDTKNSAKTSATNAVIDSLGVKEKAAAALEDNKSQIAAQLGVSEDQVDAAIEDLDIEDWEATTIPSDAVATSTSDYTYEGQDVQLTTYEDPSYVTVDAYGTSVDLAVPESAQSYVSQLQ